MWGASLRIFVISAHNTYILEYHARYFQFDQKNHNQTEILATFQISQVVCNSNKPTFDAWIHVIPDSH